MGGGISLLAQGREFRQQERVRAEDRAASAAENAAEDAERESQLAFSILAKINRAHTNIKQIKDHIHEGFWSSVRGGMEFANATKGISTDPLRIEFTSDELVLVRNLKRADLLNDLMNLPYVHDMYVENMALFKKIRWELPELASSGEVSRQGLASSVFEGANALRAKIKLHECNALLFFMLGSSIDDYHTCNNLFADLQVVLREKVGAELMRVEWGVVRRERPAPEVTAA